MTVPINPALAQGAKDVPPDPSSGQGGAPTDPSQSANPPAPDAGNQSGQADPGEPKEPRTPDNVRGELMRKRDADNAAIDVRLSRMEGMLQNIASQPAPPPTSSAPPSDINQMTSTQLEGLRPQVPEDRRGELDVLIQQRKIDESIATGIDQRLSAHQRQTLRDESNTLAHGRWPELRDQGSQFYRVTNNVLNERDAGVNSDPQVLLDAANEAGARLGLKPTSHALTPIGFDVPHGTQPPGAAPKSGMSQEKARAIAKRLQGALPHGKKFDLERVTERHGEYVDHQGLFIRQ